MIKKYKIREIDPILDKQGNLVTNNEGKPAGKKMVLKADDEQNEEPRVTVWSDHPECIIAEVGGYITGHLDKKKTDIPIPTHPGSFYVNRTLYATEMNANGTEKATGNPVLEARVAKLEAVIEWMRHNQGISEADFAAITPTESKSTTGSTDEGINPEDIPF